MDEGGFAVLQVILIGLRIFAIYYCSKRAGELNRSRGGWGVFGFFFPIVAMIWINFMKPKYVWEENPDKEE
ncbi:MAG: hypothetical protein H8D23_04955 [Candidatus Brocadiales bacterium]|nr:hypothetical protein [Candidatus Brocadiales bacterium]